MGSKCCTARKNENLSSRSTGELLQRNTIYSPSWSFRRDNRRRVAGEIENISYGLSHGISGDSSTEIKVELSLERGSPLRNLIITIPPKYPILEGLVEGHLEASSDITNINHGNIEVKSFKESKESLGVSESSSEPKIPVNESPSSSSLSTLPPISDPTTSQNNSTHPRQISDSSSSPIFIGSGSHGGSSDGWSMRTFTELVASSQRERLSLDSDSSRSPSTIDARHCGICSKLFSTSVTVAVLACGHVYHDECLVKMTEEEEQGDPSCPFCLLGSKQLVKMTRKIHLAEEKLNLRKMKILCSGGTLKDSNEVLKMVKGKLVIESSSKPFPRRQFSFGSKWSRSLSSSSSVNNRKGFWSRFH